jgi:hypothetical protein
VPQIGSGAQASQAVVLQGGAGTADFTLDYTSDKAIDLKLFAASSVDETSCVTLTAPKISFRFEGAPQNPPASAGSKQTFEIAADISNLTSSAAARIHIYYGNVKVGDIEAVAADAPINISIDGEGSANTPLVLSRNSNPTITLKNGDPISYPLAWNFQVRGKTQTGALILPASGRSTIALGQVYGEYSFGDYLRSSPQSGLLQLSLNVPAIQKIQPQTTHSLPVNLTMRPIGSNAGTIVSDSYVAIFLFLGAFLSVLASSLLPNSLRKASLRGQLNDLADRTSSVSTRVDSYLRVLLRLERKKIDIQLRAAKPISLSMSASLDSVSSDIDTLTKRVTVAERMDELRRQLEIASATAPPSVISDVDAKLQAAADQMHSFALPDENVAAANKCLDDASALLAGAKDLSIMAKQIAGNFKDLKTRIAAFPLVYMDLATALPGIFAILIGKFDDPTNITWTMTYAIDHDIAAINAALDYAVVRASVPQAASQNCLAPHTVNSTRVTEHECELLTLLGTMSWQALRDARTLVREMREDIYEKDMIEEIGKPGQAEIVLDTQVPRPYLPVNFSINFKNRWFNGAAAIDRLSCHWEFPLGLDEQGWKVCHFFLGIPEEEKNGKTKSLPAPGETPSQHKIEVKVTVQSQKAVKAPASLAPDETSSAAAGIKAAPSISPLTAPSKSGAPAASEASPVGTAEILPPAASEAAAASVAAPPVAAFPPSPPPGKPNGDVPKQQVLTCMIEIQPPAPARRSSRTVAEALRFWIAFGVALAGLLSGAVDQLQKLDLVPATLVIIALGFGADAVKNLLTQSPSPQAPNKART